MTTEPNETGSDEADWKPGIDALLWLELVAGVMMLLECLPESL